jgi:hypothetical protein
MMIECQRSMTAVSFQHGTAHGAEGAQSTGGGRAVHFVLDHNAVHSRKMMVEMQV